MSLPIVSSETVAKKMIIFGTGTYSELIGLVPIQPAYYVDNNQQRWNTEYNGIPVYPPSALDQEDPQSIVIVVASMYYADISKQLIGKGFIEQVHFFKLDEILNYFHRGEIEQYKNIHQGRRIFVIGNGPSLRISDLDRLKNEVTIASNKIYVAFDQTDWRPTYYTVIDPLLAKNNREEIRALKLRKFFARYIQPHLGEMENAHWLNQRTLYNEQTGIKEARLFSDDPSEVIYEGGTVTYFNIQLAAYMGASEIYLLGVDFHYPGLQSMPTGTRAKYTNEGQHTNTHFHPGYTKVGERNFLPELDYQYQAYQVAAAYIREKQISIYNASRFSALDVFPRVDIDQVLSSLEG